MKCRFKCKSKTEFDDGLANVHMEPVPDSPENKEFFKYNPNGYFDVASLNPDIAKQFTVGKEYTIEITPVK